MNNLSTPVALSGLESAVLQSANVLSVVGEQPVSKDEAASILASWRELNRCAEQAGIQGCFRNVSKALVNKGTGEVFFECTSAAGEGFDITAILPDSIPLFEYAAPEQLGVTLPLPPVRKPEPPNTMFNGNMGAPETGGTDVYVDEWGNDNDESTDVIPEDYNPVAEAVTITLPQYGPTVQPQQIFPGQTLTVRRGSRATLDGSTILINPLFKDGKEISRRLSRNHAELIMDEGGTLYIKPLETANGTALEQKTGDYITRKELDPHTLHKIDLPAVVMLGKAIKMKLTKGEGR